jgi:hypothetical protein
MADMIELFLQGEGRSDITLIKVPPKGTTGEILARARDAGIAIVEGADGSAVFVEDGEEPLASNAGLDALGIGNRSRVHVHRCRHVQVTVNFQNDTRSHSFAPATTVGRVLKWAVGKQGFNLADLDAAEHALQLTGTTSFPNEDAHLGALTGVPSCQVSFDLVPKDRVQG